MNNNLARLRVVKKKYEEVGKLILKENDFKKENLKSSRSLFLKDSILRKKPIPIDVDLYAILSGISFRKKDLEFLENIRNKIENILKEETFFLVKPKNMGVEYSILKWPEDKLDIEVLNRAKQVLQDWKEKPFFLTIFGIQLHLDGCIILKGIDTKNEIKDFRSMLKSKIKKIPDRQSEWTHIPLGRILAPIGKEKMKILKNFFHDLDKNLNYDLLIKEVHLVREKQWYMEKKTYLLTKKFE